MRYRFALPGRTAGALAVCVTVAGLLSTPVPAASLPQGPPGVVSRTSVPVASPQRGGPGAVSRTPVRAASPSQASGAVASGSAVRVSVPSPVGADVPVGERPAAQARRISPAQLPPRAAFSPRSLRSAGTARPKTGSCGAADFGSRSGAALVAFVKGATTDCVNTLFSVTGTDAHAVFRQSQMLSVADAFTAHGPALPGRRLRRPVAAGAVPARRLLRAVQPPR